MGNSKRVRLAVLVSGGGTNLQALIDRMREGTLAAQVVAVISDRPDAYGLRRAENAGIPSHVVDYGSHLHGDTTAHPEISPVDLDALDKRQRILSHQDREVRIRKLARLVEAERKLIGIIDRYEADYICLAGYMRLLTPFFLSHYNKEGSRRVLNIHPALLPSFPGQHGYEDTFEYGSKWGGVTVHFVDEGEDTGPVIAQAVYPIWPRDSIEAVRRRGLQLEYMLYAQCINWLAQGQVEIACAPGRRPRVVITDPNYSSILRSWVEAAFTNETAD